MLRVSQFGHSPLPSVFSYLKHEHTDKCTNGEQTITLSVVKGQYTVVVLLSFVSVEMQMHYIMNDDGTQHVEQLS